MSKPIITCPNCHTKIKLTESLAAPLINEAFEIEIHHLLDFVEPSYAVLSRMAWMTFPAGI